MRFFDPCSPARADQPPPTMGVSRVEVVGGVWPTLHTQLNSRRGAPGSFSIVLCEQSIFQKSALSGLCGPHPPALQRPHCPKMYQKLRFFGPYSSAGADKPPPTMSMGGVDTPTWVVGRQPLVRSG